MRELKIFIVLALFLGMLTTVQGALIQTDFDAGTGDTFTALEAGNGSWDSVNGAFLSTASGNSRVQITSDTSFDATTGSYTLTAVFNGDPTFESDQIYRAPTYQGTWVGFQSQDGWHNNVDTKAFGVGFGGYLPGGSSGDMAVTYNDGSDGRAGNRMIPIGDNFGEAIHRQMRDGFTVELTIDDDGWDVTVTAGHGIHGILVSQGEEALIDEVFTSSGSWEDIDFSLSDLGQQAMIAAHLQTNPTSSQGGAVLDISQMTLVPEPATVMLLGLGSLSLVARRKRK